ncbi:TPA: RCC1 domain-containing protein [Elizabethkingia anophelis]
MKKQFLKNKTFIFICLNAFFLFLSCRSANDETIKEGIGILKINMQGTEFSGNERGMLSTNASISPLMKGMIRNENADVEIARIPLKGDYVLIASLSPEAPTTEQGLQASTLNNIQAKSSISKVPNGVKYRVVVYDSEGGFVDQKVYTTGQNISDDGQDLKLNGGTTYKFVVFSYNSAEVPPSVTSADPKSCDISGNKDFMYYTTEMLISGETTNYLNVVMQHKYTKINVTLDTSEIGTATEVSGVTITPHHVGNKIDLTTGTITYDSNPVIIPFTLSNGSSPNILTGSSLICSPTGTSTLSIASMTIAGQKQPNKSTEIPVTPGNNINLNLKVQRIVTINVIQIASSWYHTVALTASGDVYGTGHITYGELGPKNTIQEIPTRRGIFSDLYITNYNKLNIDNAKKIAVNDGSTYILKKNGELYVGGANDRGQLGTGNRNNTGENGNFVKVDFYGGVIKDIVGCYNQIFILTEQGKVFATGRNNDGQLGLGDTSDRMNFVNVMGLDDQVIEQISAGKYHVIAKTTTNRVFGAGLDNNGQLGGNGNSTQFIELPISSSIDYSAIKTIKASENSTYLLTTSGKLYVTGYNRDGQLGIGNKVTQKGFSLVPALLGQNIVDVYGFSTHAIAITNTGDLYATGDNSHGQLGFGDQTSKTLFTKVQTLTTPIISALDGPTSQHTIVIGSTGQVFGVGNNDYAVLGLGTINVKYLSFKILPLKRN